MKNLRYKVEVWESKIKKIFNKVKLKLRIYM